MAEQARQLGLEEEVQGLLKEGAGDPPPAKSILAGFSLKAEEEIDVMGELAEEGETVSLFFNPSRI